MRISALGLAFASLPAVFAANYDVTVAPGGELVFSPEYVQAAIGDTVTFTFNPKNHTVTQSTFDQPCKLNPEGFNTNFVPVDVGATDLPYRVLTVNHTNPIWFYCQQQKPEPHCAKGMVFAINPPPEGDPRSFSAFKALAMSSATPSSSAVDNWSTPPPQTWYTATATVSNAGSTWVTTYTSYEGTTQPTFAPQPVDHKIVVGVDGQLAFGPANISAAIGDTVTFEFHPKNHGVVQSSFSQPCQPLQESTGVVGFNSGLMPVSADATEFPTFRITINDTAPIWGYCPQTQPMSHCGAGMVFSINAVESGPNNFANFQELAKRMNGSPTSSGGNSAPSGGSSDNTNDNNGAISSLSHSSMSVVGLISLTLVFFA
ncbi:hypothetical protein Moror_8387 [Moniliophthora roreri MCA 2997]|uniref:Cupredoxin n=2 Tax=Moniliophthora roreri TaxID=221103 RepID=V2XKE3_MONRO|nr:hypothetical protein Moror_8387 [Moniliophthora roreri MCA 2997]KAI3619487.1 hypothetical protein WG66_012679 [Moniliophthora roreri]